MTTPPKSDHEKRPFQFEPEGPFLRVSTMLLITPISPNFKELKCSVFGRFRALQSRNIYGDTEKPQDYLDSFVAYVNENKDRIEAIRIACTRPSDMTRAQLRELKLELDKENFTESSLNEAASAVSNERIVADIIAFVRRAVLKTPLVNHDDRVKMAFSKLISAHHFNKMQLDLLEKIKVYMLHESILNTETFEAPAFKMDGGFARFNKKFGGQLAEIIREINTYIYEGAA